MELPLLAGFEELWKVLRGAGAPVPGLGGIPTTSGSALTISTPERKWLEERLGGQRPSYRKAERPLEQLTEENMRVIITVNQAKALIETVAVEAEQVGLTDLAPVLKKWAEAPRAAVDLAQIMREAVLGMEAARRGKE